MKLKKFLWIVVLCLFNGNFANAEELTLKCTYKHIDTQYPMYKVGDDTYLIYDLSSKEYIVNEGYIKFYSATKVLDSHYLNYSEIHRLSGEKIERSVGIEKEEFKKFENLDKMNKDEKTFNKIFRAVNDKFFEIKTSNLAYNDKPMWGEWRSDCEKAKKKF